MPMELREFPWQPNLDKNKPKLHKISFWSFANHGVKHNDFCCFRGMTYVALTLCFKLRSFFYIDNVKRHS